MRIFIDTAEIKEIEEMNRLGIVDGVTTNPSLIAKSKRKFTEIVREICGMVDGPVSMEVLSTDYAGMLKEAKEYSKIADNVVIKIPLIPDGIRCVNELTGLGIQTNVTLCFSAPQALLAAKVGATYVSPFIGRIDDLGYEGMDLISDIRSIYDNYEFHTQILAASVRHPLHFKEVALLGADVATVPYSTLKMIFKHPLTDIGLSKFLEDAKDIVL